jgi:hypothetical protein
MTTVMSRSKKTPNELAYNNFIDSIKSPKTKSDYIKNFGYFLKFVNKTYDNLEELLHEDTKELQQVIIDYIKYMRQRHSSSYVAANISPIKKFFSMNDVLLNWDKIKVFEANMCQ